jgi:ADP-ribose pyrophosphatase YjhB (NUDIX family)
MLRDQLSLYLAFLGAPVCEEVVTWGQQVLRVRNYLTEREPPAEYVTSVRCVVIRGDEVLVVRDPDEVHILPGGRVAPGETFQQTAVRELQEATGWTVGKLRQVGIKHFHHLSPKPARYPYPYADFLQLVYLADPLYHDPALKEANGWELGAEFAHFSSATVSTLRLSHRHFLMAARRQLALARA